MYLDHGDVEMQALPNHLLAQTSNAVHYQCLSYESTTFSPGSTVYRQVLAPMMPKPSIVANVESFWIIIFNYDLGWAHTTVKIVLTYIILSLSIPWRNQSS
jgi:hypothetical protein